MIEIIGDDDNQLAFVAFDTSQNPFVRWLLECTKLRKMKYHKDRGSDIIGLKQLKELRNVNIVRQQAGVFGRRSSVSSFLLRKMELKGELHSVEFVEISVDGSVVKVLPRSKKDQEVLHVCSQDIAACIAFIKKQGLSEDEDLPQGIRKRKNYKGDKKYYQIMKRGSDGKAQYSRADNVEDAIEALHQDV